MMRSAPSPTPPKPRRWSSTPPAGEGTSPGLIGLLFFAIGVLDFNAATWAAYHHTRPGVKARKAAERAAEEAAKRCEVDLSNLREQVRRWRAARRRGEAEGQSAAARVDELIARDAALWEITHPRPDASDPDRARLAGRDPAHRRRRLAGRARDR